MSIEEQTSFFNTTANASAARLERKLDAFAGRTISELETIKRGLPASSLGRDPVPVTEVPIAELSVARLNFVHRALTEGSEVPESDRGVLRAMEVVVGQPDQPDFRPPPAGEVLSRLETLFSWWAKAYPSLRSAGAGEVATAIARLHHELLFIHPYLDANGRTAVFLADQAADTISGRRLGPGLTGDRKAYFEALRSADRGDLGPLTMLIRASLL